MKLNRHRGRATHLYGIRGASATLGAVATLLVFGAFAPAPAAARAASDAAATHAYLEAAHVWVESYVANTQASEASMQGFARKVDGECAGVAQNAFEKAIQISSKKEIVRTVTRERNESMDLESELEAAVGTASVEPDRSALTQFLAAIAPLHWSSRKVTLWVRGEVIGGWKLAVNTPLDVCADLRSWAASGYSKLSAATRGFTRRREALEREFRATLAGYAKLRRYERQYNEALVRRVKQLSPGVSALRTAKQTTIGSLDRELGLPEGPGA